jgi:hypothetical protein
MATTGTGQGSSGMGSTDWSNTAGSQQQRDRRAVGDATSGAGTGRGDASGGDSGIAQTLRDTTYRSIDDQKSRASETLGSLAGAVRGMTQPLRDGGQPQIADYVNKAADGIERWATNMRQQDLEDAVRAVEQFARRQPAMFLGVAFGAGLVAARFLKSSNRNGEMRSYGGNFNPSPRTSSVGSVGMGGTSLGSTGGGATSMGTGGLGTSGLGSTGTGSGGGGTGGTGTRTTSGDTPRLSSDIRSAGEVL